MSASKIGIFLCGLGCVTVFKKLIDISLTKNWLKTERDIKNKSLSAKDLDLNKLSISFDLFFLFLGTVELVLGLFLILFDFGGA